MSKRTPKETLKSFSWIYVILAAFYAVATILCFAVPDVANELKKGLGDDGMIGLGTAGALTVLFNLWYFWLAGRVVDGKSNGTLYMILLILGIVGSITSFLTTKTLATGVLSLDFIVDIFGLYFLCEVRNQKKK